MFSRTFLSLGLLFSLSASTFADLQWDKPIQSFRFTPDTKEVEAHFTFKNTGKTTVIVKNIKVSCGCTVTKLEKKIYGPGEGGDLVATYAFHGETGEMRKLVFVNTDDKPDQPQTLDIRVSVHEPFDIKPVLVYWRVGDPAEPKSATLTAESFPVHIKSVSSSNPRITATLQTVKLGEEYNVAIKPTDTAAKETAEITVLTDFPADAPKSYTIHARVK